MSEEPTEIPIEFEDGPTMGPGSEPDDNEPDATETLEATPEQLLAESEDRCLRLAAEFDNFRKRTARDQSRMYAAAEDDTLREVLATLDNLDRALSHEPGCDEAKAILDGVRLVRDGLWGTLSSKFCVKRIEADGAAFDPELMDAVAHVASDEDEGSVLEVTLQGYTRGDRVLRHAQVVVSAGELVEDNEGNE
jgi:molecular chaperone GrpE